MTVIGRTAVEKLWRELVNLHGRFGDAAAVARLEAALADPHILGMPDADPPLDLRAVGDGELAYLRARGRGAGGGG